DIDRAICSGLGIRLAALGPLQIWDFTGHDVVAKVFSELAPKICSSTDVPRALRRLVKAGRLGVKAGRGIYRYTPKSAEAKRVERDRKFLALAELLYAGR